jgi:hypothetical protein
VIHGSDNISLELSLIDKKLDELMPLSTFITADEYRNIYDKLENWHSKIPYLKNTIFKNKRIDFEKLEKNKFPIKLFSTIPNHTIFDSVATVPIEFQYINTKDIDVIVLRMDLGDNRYNIATIEINDEVLTIIQTFFEKITASKQSQRDLNPFETAYFNYIHENGRYILNSKKEIFNNWEYFYDDFRNNYGFDIEEYSSTGRYLWQRDFILLDNRAHRNYKIYSLENQWKDISQNIADKEEKTIVSKTKEKRDFFNISSLYIDKNGNYWSTKEAYQKYCNFINI